MKYPKSHSGDNGNMLRHGSSDDTPRDKLLHLAFSCDLVLDVHAATLDPDLRLSLSCMIDRLLYEAERWPSRQASAS